MEQPDPWIPDQPTAKIYKCAHCGAYPLSEPICIPCHNAFMIGLRSEVSMGALSDWTLLNHRQMLCLAAASMLARESGAYVPYTTIVHLIVARAIRNGDI